MLIIILNKHFIQDNKETIIDIGWHNENIRSNRNFLIQVLTPKEAQLNVVLQIRIPFFKYLITFYYKTDIFEVTQNI